MVPFWGNSSKIPHCNNTIMSTITKTVPQWCPKLLPGACVLVDTQLVKTGIRTGHISRKYLLRFLTNLSFWPYRILQKFFQWRLRIYEKVFCCKYMAITGLFVMTYEYFKLFKPNFFSKHDPLYMLFLKVITRFHETLKVTTSLPFSTHAFWRSLCISYRSVDNSIR